MPDKERRPVLIGGVWVIPDSGVTVVPAEPSGLEPDSPWPLDAGPGASVVHVECVPDFPSPDEARPVQGGQDPVGDEALGSGGAVEGGVVQAAEEDAKLLARRVYIRDYMRGYRARLKAQLAGGIK